MRRVIFGAAGLSAAALAAIGLVVRRRWAVPDEMLPVEPAPMPPAPSAVMPLHAVESAAPTTGESELAAGDSVSLTEPSIEADFGPVSAGPGSPLSLDTPHPTKSPPPTKRAAKPRARPSRAAAAKPTEPET